MAYDAKLAERIRDVLDERCEFEERKMFGGLCFMVTGHMCVGIVDRELMARVGPDAYGAALKRKHARPMDFTGRPMKGFIYVGVEGFKTKRALSSWVELCLDFVRALPPK